MRNTQKDGPGQVKAIQSLGVPVIALTSRGMEYQLQTFRELRRNGYNFSFSSIGPPGGYKKPIAQRKPEHPHLVSLSSPMTSRKISMT